MKRRLQLQPILLAHILIFGISRDISAQINSIDLSPFQPPISVYDDKNHDDLGGTFGISQDKKGILFIGISSGIISFDGRNWETTHLPNGSAVLSVSPDTIGSQVLYVGGVNELGYIAPDSIGQLIFYSLLKYLPEEHHGFGNVWDTHVTPEGVFFRTAGGLFRWNGEEFATWEPQQRFDRSFWVEEKLYVQERNGSMMQLEQDNLVVAPGGSSFQNSRAFAILPYSQDTLLVVSRYNGLFQWTDDQLIPFKTDADAFLPATNFYRAILLSDGTYAIATYGEGVIRLNRQGQLLDWIKKEAGLTGGIVRDLWEDPEKGVWGTLYRGVARIEFGSPFRIYTDHPFGDLPLLLKKHGEAYIGSVNGIFQVDNKTLTPIQKIEGIKGPVRFMVRWGDHLLLTSNEGVFGVKNNELLFSMPGERAKIVPDVMDSTLVWALVDGQLFGLKNTGSGVQLTPPLTSSLGNISYAKQLNNRDLLIATEEGITRINLPETYNSSNLKQSITVTVLDSTHEIQPQRYVLRKAADKVFALPIIVDPYATDYLLQYDLKKKKFVRDTFLKHITGFREEASNPLFEDPKKNIMVVESFHPKGELYTYSTVNQDKDGAVFRGSLNRVNLPYIPPEAIMPDSESPGTYYFGRTDGHLIRFDHNLLDPAPHLSPPIIRGIYGKNDSMMRAPAYFLANQSLVLPFRHNQITFTFSLPQFDAPDQHLFQWKLEGQDEEWSSWSTNNQKEFTFLPAGNYTFRLKAMDTYHRVHPEVSYSFRVLPPWYQSVWAYLLYALAGGLLIWLIFRMRFKRLKREKQKLEQIVKERTREVALQAEELRELDQVKSQFFANISHEFRTPLTLVLGPLENRLQQKEQPKLHELQIMHRNAKRLERLINQLLDLSRIESGKLQLQPQNGDIIAFLKALSSSFSSHAEQRDIEFQLNFPKEGLDCSFDPDKVEKIAYNLLSNAFKFTPDGGLVEVKVKKTEKEIFFEVKDSGQGIPADELPHIFDRFYRSSDARKKEQEGTGIGLALTKELVKLHRGRIHADSQIGRGSTFTVALPVVPAKSTEGKSIPAIPSQTGAIVEGKKGMINPLPVVAEQEDRPILLVVEDNEDLRAYMANILSPQFRILEAGDGRQGFDLAKSKVPDLIISDLMMPEMDGIELCGQLKTNETTSHIPVILLTAKANRESKLEGLSTGADDYLIKPFNAEELKVRVKNLIDQRKLLQQRFSKTVVLKPRDIAINSMDEVFLEKVMAIIEKNMDNADFSVEDFQKAIGMSRMQLHRKLKALTNHSTTEFIRIQRLKRAASLLEQNGGNVSEVCYQVGFNSLSYFTKMFKEQFGVTPSKYGK